MRARLTYSDIATALDAVKPAVSSSRPFVRLRTTEGGLEVAADDLNVAITARIDSWHPMDEDPDGTAVVSFRLLREFLAAVGDDIEIEASDERLIVAHGATRIDLALATSAEFPERQPLKDTDVSVTLGGRQWASVRSLVPFASTDPSHGPRCGVNFYDDCAVASDGFILGLVRNKFGFQIAVPAGVIDAVGKNADEVKLAADDRTLRIEADGVVVTTTRLAGDLGPGWRKYLEAKATATLVVDAAELAAAVSVARIPARVGLGGGKDMVLRFDDRVVLESWPDENGQGEIARYPLECDVQGVTWDRMALQERWLDAPIKLVGADEDGKVTFLMTDSGAPVIFENGDLAALVMPLARPPA